VGAGVGAAVAAPELSCARHWARNCGQVSPFVVPAALAACHCSPHCFMTLWALAVAAIPRRIAVANANRIAFCIETSSHRVLVFR
jgi:hypothetical protein